MFKAVYEHRDYLGDSVYIEKGTYYLRLFLDDGVTEDSVIYFDDDVVTAFLAYLAKHKPELLAASNKAEE